MLIYNKHPYQVVQHPHVQYFVIKKWKEGDDPRSYDRKFDYFTIKQCNSIDEVNQWFKENVWKKEMVAV